MPNYGKRNCYERLADFKIPDAFQLLDKEQTLLFGYKIKYQSERYDTFRRDLMMKRDGSCTIKCIVCGLEATHFGLDHDKLVAGKSAHFNLYGLDDAGKEVMFTKGVSSTIGERHTTCEKCMKRLQKQKCAEENSVKVVQPV